MERTLDVESVVGASPHGDTHNVHRKSEQGVVNMSYSGDEFGPEGMAFDELSDDDLDLIAGGIPHDARDPGFGALGHQNPTMHAARIRPTDDASLWY